VSKNLDRYGKLKNDYKDYKIIQTIMVGGIVPTTVQRTLFEEGWLKAGYANCYDCLEGRSCSIGKPPIRDFLPEVAEFYGGDVAQHIFGCRAAQFAVMKTVSDEIAEDYARTIVADPLCHYTTAIAAEMTGFSLVEPPHSGHPEYKVDPEGFAKRIEEVKAKTGKLPALIVVTHVEPYNGNVNPVEEVGKIAKEYGIPYMVNAAYTAGVMPLNMKDLQADFLTVSAHKSMASLGPLGFLVTNDEWAEKAFKTASIVLEWSGRAFGMKTPSIFGCSIGGTPLISAMYSYPYVVERVARWDEELKKTRWFVGEMEKLGGSTLVGERPHRHHLLHFETPLFGEISKRHKRRGFFLADEMLGRRIVGLQRGLSRHIKLSVYGLSWDEVREVRDAFYDVAEKYVKEYKLEGTIPRTVEKEAGSGNQ